MNKLKRIIAALVLLVAPIAAPLVANIQPALAAVDTCTWTGTTSANWATATNWTGCDNGNVPENGDTLVFPQSASNKVMNNNTTVQPQFMTFSGTGYSLAGAAITIAGASNGITASESASIGVAITYSGTNSTNAISAGKTLAFTSTVAFALSGTSVWNGGGTTTFAGAVTGSAGTSLRSSGAGSTIAINGTGNTFTTTRVGAELDGIFECNSLTCFGDPANIIYAGSGTINLRLAATYANPIETGAVTASDSWLKAYDNVTLSGTTTITDSIGISQVGTGAKTLLFSNTMAVASGSSASFFGLNSTDSTIRLTSTLSGTTAAVSVASVFLELSGANTYTGSTTVNSGAIVSAKSATALGSVAGATQVLSGGSIVFDAAAPVTNGETISIAGTGVAGKGALYAIANNVTKLNGSIALTADALVAQRSTVCTGTPTLQLNGLISGTGNLTTEVQANSCKMIIGDTAVVAGGNTFSGTLTHIGGFLDLNKDLAAPHNAVLAPTNGSISTVIALLAPATNAVGGTMSTVSNNNATDFWDVLNNETSTELSSTTGLDGLKLCKGQIFTLNQATDTTFNGTFGLNGGCTGADPLFTKAGVGTLFLTRDKAVGVMNIAVTAGTLSVNANFGDAAFTVSGGTLKGIATLGAVTGASGHFAAGNSPGCTTAASLAMSSGFNFDEELGGTTACSGYDRTTVTGAAVLGNATLNVTHYGGFVPAVGNSFTILQAASVSGTFNGLADGATFVVAGVTYRINYTATTVILTVQSSTVAASLANTGVPVLASTALAGTIIVLAIGATSYKKVRKHVLPS
jgi:fibronectin-binding autotransporter adhesin